MEESPSRLRERGRITSTARTGAGPPLPLGQGQGRLYRQDRDRAASTRHDIGIGFNDKCSRDKRAITQGSLQNGCIV